jgi:REP element-mobilizing transposase RayT
MAKNRPMTQPRKRLVSLSDTPYYHCISRCVRRAFLCGTDPVSGFDFSHRRGWIVDRLKRLSAVFAIDLCAYAVMSNHYHVVVHVDRALARSWSDSEVVRRWLELFSGPPLAQRFRAGDSLSDAELAVIAQWAATWRARLHDISWFMRCLNEVIARLANREDGCTGRFWEGRFKSQALLDERAVLACMAYVDLNPIRAGLARTPEHSQYTSIKERIDQPEDNGLRRFSGNADETECLPFRFEDYLQVVDWSGRALVAGKKGFIPVDAPPILTRLGMQPSALLSYLRQRPGRFHTAIGPADSLRALAQSVGQKFIQGISFGRALCPQTA